MKSYIYKVAWCNVCDQGWVEIVKAIESEKLMLQCSECLSQWENLNEYQEERFIDDEVRVTEPGLEEIEGQEWHKFIIQS